MIFNHGSTTLVILATIIVVTETLPNQSFMKSFATLEENILRRHITGQGHHRRSFAYILNGAKNALSTKLHDHTSKNKLPTRAEVRYNRAKLMDVGQ